MKCYYCGASLDRSNYCPQCDADVRVWKKISAVSNRLYNEGLERAKVRDLSGAVECLRSCLRYNKRHMSARNLLGLVYFEMGESVNAVSEWVISKSLNPEDNPAETYLGEVQNNSARLESLNQTIKKFNQALAYCRQGNHDLALIQLKKVLALNPKLVKAHQLLALLYMKQERYDLARKTLKNARRVDNGNTDTRLYMRECSQRLREMEPKPPVAEEDEIVSYQSGNETIIRPAKFGDNTTRLTLINLLVGAAIGIAVVCFLIIPSIRKNANTDATSQLVKANETISTREQSIKSLESQIEDMKKQVSDAKTSTDSAEQKVTSYESLLNAYVAYAAKNYDDAGTYLSDVKQKLLSDDAKKIYEDMSADVNDQLLGTKINQAINTYAKKNYTEAITLFKEIIDIDEAYQDYDAPYYMAYAYMFQKDYKNATKWFQKVVDNASSSSKRNRASQNIAEMEALSNSNNNNSGSGDNSTGN